MVSYPLIKEGQLSHKYAIVSSVEPMNLLSKGSNKLLPKYLSTIWKNGLLPPCSILLLARLRCSCTSYNLMYPSQMLNCTHDHIIIRVKMFSDLLASLGSTEFQPHLEWKNHEACILLLLSAWSGGIMRYVYIYWY